KVIGTRTGPGIQFTFGISFLIGNGDGTFQPSFEYFLGANPADPSAAEGPYSDPQLASVRVSGGSELAVAWQSTTLVPTTVQTFQAGATSPVLTGTYPIFTVPPSGNSADSAHRAPASEVVGDFNGDGIPDLVITSAVQGSILLGNGDGTFQAELNPPNLAGPVIAADFNGDGKTDLA